MVNLQLQPDSANTFAHDMTFAQQTSLVETTILYDHNPYTAGIGTGSVKGSQV